MWLLYVAWPIHLLFGFYVHLCPLLRLTHHAARLRGLPAMPGIANRLQTLMLTEFYANQSLREGRGGTSQSRNPKHFRF